MPSPIEYADGQFAVNGQAFRKWMLQDRGDGDNNATALISRFLGDEILEDFLSNSAYMLVVEPIMWSNKYTFQSDSDFGVSRWYANPKTLLLGTANEWARYMRIWGDGLQKDSYGKGCYIEVIYSSTLSNSLIIERKDTYFEPPTVLGVVVKLFCNTCG